MKGNIKKMQVMLTSPVQYKLPMGEDFVAVNELLGKTIHLQHTGEINCIACGRKTSKSYAQGYCYPCFRDLAECDICIMKPETCHYDAGTCRQPDWAEEHCMQPHYVYLANSSGIKVGITRGSQVPTRWIDQGASQALPIYKVKTRYQSGLLEVELKNHVSDRTDWRKMLKGQPESLDLGSIRDQLSLECLPYVEQLRLRFGDDAIEYLPAEEIVEIHYPVDNYPEKIKPFNFDKQPEIQGKLLGVKGQYLLLDNGVLNIRKYAGYNIELDVQ